MEALALRAGLQARFRTLARGARRGPGGAGDSARAQMRPSIDLRRLAPAVLPDLLCFATLAALCAARLGGLSRWLDLGLFDEADYLRRGLLLPSAGLPDPEWGPLYSLWYLALSSLESNRVALYELSYRLLVLLPTAVLYACIRRLGGAAPLALLGSVLFALSPAAHVLPRPTLLALLLLLVALLASTAPRQAHLRFAALGLGALLAGFARPELFASFLLLSGLTAVAAWRSPGGKRHLALYGLVAAALVSVLGNPLADRSERRRYAFCQHFALGYVKRTGLDLNPWNDCDAVLARVFGPGVKSVGMAVQRNAGAVAEHVQANLLRYPEVSLELFTRAGPGAWMRRHELLVAWALAWMLWAFRDGARRLRDAWPEPGFHSVGALWLAVLVPTLLSALLVFPREHYLVLQGVFTPLLLVAAARLPGVSGFRAATASGLAAALVAWLCTASAAPSLRELPHRAAVATLAPHALRSGSPDAPVGLLEAQGGYALYLGPHVRQVSALRKRTGEGFTEFLQRQGVGLVFVDEWLTRDTRLRDDPEFLRFVAHPEQFGFTRHAVPGSAAWIARRGTPRSQVQLTSAQ